MAERTPIERDIYFFMDDEGLSIDQVVKRTPDKWQISNEDINFGYLDDHYWFRVQVTNTSMFTLDRVLEISYPLLDNVEFYQASGRLVLSRYVTGDKLKFDSRPIKHRNFIFPFTIPPGQTHDIYLHIETEGALKVPMVIWDEHAFYEHDGVLILENAIGFGVMLMMAMFMLTLYFSLREDSFLTYVLFVLSVLLLISSTQGFTYQYIYPSSPSVHDIVLLTVVSLTQLSVCLFTMTFFRLRTQAPYLYWFFVFLGALQLIMMVVSTLVPYGIATRLSIFMSIPVVATCFFTGIRFWEADNLSAKLFAIGWVAFIAGAALNVLSRLGVLPSSFFTEYGMPVAVVAQSVLFALALSSRVTNERDARLSAQENMYTALKKQREAEKQLIHSVSHSEITGLPNRVLFEQALQNFINHPPEGKPCIAVVMMHIRRFDEVNKTLGHRNADKLLNCIGERITTVLGRHGSALPVESLQRETVYVAHIEGVSFAFSLASESRDIMLENLEPLLREMSEPIEFMQLQLEVGFIVGCSFADPESDPQTLLREAFIAFDTADTRMNGVAVYSPDMNPYSPRRLTLMTELRAALDNDSLELFFQPQIHLIKNTVCGFEALLRWNHKEYGMVPPDEFIPMAETTGLMKPLTRWVMKKAVCFCRELDLMGCTAYVSVNISALNLRETNFCDQVMQTLNDADVKPERLVLEITETAAMVDPATSAKVLNELREQNIRVSIDDFGTGHSSLSYIRKLPVQEIKIDRSFVMEMDSNKNDETIVRTTVNMCHDLGYEVVAEGVENGDIVKLLARLNCDVIQGYFIARPMNQAAMLEWLKNTNWKLSPESDMNNDIEQPNLRRV